MEDALIVKLLGRNLRYDVLSEQIKFLWKPKGTLTFSNVGNHFYVLHTSNKADYETALFGGPC